MTKDEMKDKISMALKDPILQMGFEVICSKLSRLEKENAELDCQMNRNKYCYSCANVTDRCFRNEIGCPCEKYKSYKDENVALNERLTKVKELIEELSSSLSVVGECEEEECELLNRAEQFLRENE